MITKEMLNIWDLSIDVLQDVRAKTVEQYMEYPAKDSSRKWVMQSHIRGESQHLDLRMEFNDHLLGWSIVGGSTSDPVLPKSLLSRQGEGFLAETKCWSENCNEWKYNIEERLDGFYAIPKGERETLSLEIEELARQPKIWLTVHGDVKPGEVGAGAEVPGKFIIEGKGTFWEGTQKPYFHEYFLKGGPFRDYTRFILRAIRVMRIDPETKKPREGQYELLWRAMVPKDQEAYALSRRAQSKNWKPPKGIIPIPPNQRKGEAWDKWLEYMKTEEKSKTLETLPFAGYKNFEDCVRKNQDKTNPEAYCGFIKHKVEGSESKKIHFTVQRNSWMGPIHVRGIPNIEYYLRLDQKGYGPVRSFTSTSNPLFTTSVSLVDEGTVPRKYLTFDGEIKPGQKYNPTLDLIATMKIVDQGTVDVESSISEQGQEVLNLTFHGKDMKGKATMTQEEKKSDFYTLEYLSMESLAKYDFVLDRHYWDKKEHWDLRWKISDTHKQEFNLYHDPLELKEEERCRAIFKNIVESEKELEEWMVTEGTGLVRMVGPVLETKIDVLDHGSLNVIDQDEEFISLMIHGQKLKGYYIARRDEPGWYFMKSRLPNPKSELEGTGDPTSGKYYDPFLLEKKEGWNYYWLRIYDMRKFSRCILDYKQYLPDLTLDSKIQDILVCLYPRPGTTHSARVAAVKVSADMTESDAVSWIKAHSLHTFSSALIRVEKTLSTTFELPELGKKKEELIEPIMPKAAEDEALMKIVDEELKKRSKTDEERKIELSLKKKKLELIDRWLDENKGETE